MRIFSGAPFRMLALFGGVAIAAASFVACADKTAPTAVNLDLTGITCSGAPTPASKTVTSTYTSDAQIKFSYPTYIPMCNGYDRLSQFAVSQYGASQPTTVLWSFWYCDPSENPADCYVREPNQQIQTTTDTITVLVPGTVPFVGASVQVGTGSGAALQTSTIAQAHIRGPGGNSNPNGSGYTCSSNGIGYPFTADGGTTYYRRNFCSNQKEYRPY